MPALPKNNTLLLRKVRSESVFGEDKKLFQRIPWVQMNFLVF